MAAPTFNKYRSTTIYGALQVRDFTNSAGTTVLEVASTDLSGNFLSRGDSTFTKKVVCNASVGDINANNVLTTKQYVDSAVSGGSILASNNTFTGLNTFNNDVDISGNIICNKEITQEFAPLGTYVNKFLSTAFLESVVFKSFSQDGSDANILDNLTLGGDVGSSLGLELSFDAGITQSGTATNTLKNLTLGDTGLTINDVNNTPKITINPTLTTYDSQVDISGNLLRITNATENDGEFQIVNPSNVVKVSISSLGMNQTDTTGENRFSGTTYFDNEILQTDATLITYVNKLIRTLFLKQIEAVSILRVNDTNYMFNDAGNDSALRVAAGDYPYVLSGGSQVLYTTPQRFSIAAQQTIAGSQISINQTTTTATNTANYAIANSIISTFTIPPQFSKRITLNIPISIRNAGTWSVGTSLSATITNTINSITAMVYVNGILYGTNPSVVIQNSNSSTRSTTIAYTSAAGSKTIALDQYFFNINIILTDFFASTYMTRDNNITNTLQIVLSANITNTITRNSNTGNFTANNTLTFVSNTGVSTSTISTTGTPTITYSPNQNGTNYAAATSTPNYIDPVNTLGGTTYTNHLRANSFNLLPAGMIIQYTGSTAPTGWLLCDGTAYNASTNPIYQELFNVIGNQFGGTDNTDFKVPDYRGAFLRGTGTNGVAGYTAYIGQALNTPQAHATQTHTHTATQAVHTHQIRFKGNGNSAVQTSGGSVLFNPNATSFGSPDSIDIQTGQRLNNGTQFENVAPAITVANSTTSVNANETRPFSYSVNYLIKF